TRARDQLCRGDEQFVLFGFAGSKCHALSDCFSSRQVTPSLEFFNGLLDEQAQIVVEVGRILSVCFVLEADIETNLQKAEALRQSILKKAFAGELVPQDLNDEPASVLLARIRAERESAAASKAESKSNSKPKKVHPVKV
ncbi:MAG: hypothetical protein P4N60_00005, partial [Verrucomicrobiae bacterium]|nr:hypothetical protein [Verrucomicrobiae bacterium]